jgi:hypothetical protein
MYCTAAVTPTSTPTCQQLPCTVLPLCDTCCQQCMQCTQHIRLLICARQSLNDSKQFKACWYKAHWSHKEASVLGCRCANKDLAVSILVNDILTSALPTEHPPGSIGAHAGAAFCAAHDSTAVDVAGAVHIPALAAGHHHAIVHPHAIVARAHARARLAADAGTVGQPVACVRVVTGGLHWWWGWQRG